MKYSVLSADSRRALINAQQLYENYLEVGRRLESHRGGMRWKKTNNREYLFRTRGGRGYGKSLGVRSAETEEIYEQFHKNKTALEVRKRELLREIQRQSKICVAMELVRVPKMSADILRSLDQAGLMGHGLRVVGTHAIYAYEVAAGVFVEQGLMETKDVDLLFDAEVKLRLSGEIDATGLIGLLKRVDKTFEVVAEGGFSAVNSRGFMVELVKPVPKPPMKVEAQSIGHAPNDLVAAEMEGFRWLKSAPPFIRIAIAEDGFPVRIHAPDPRFFALNKLWVSQRPSRNPLKKPRDYAQAKVVASLAESYLGLSFEDDALQVFPEEIRMLLKHSGFRSGDDDNYTPPGL